MQAKDIPNERALAAVHRVRHTAQPEWEYQWAMRWDVEAELAEFHPKVVIAKMRALKRRRWLNGCDCGCRGDFVILVCIACKRTRELHPLDDNGRCSDCNALAAAIDPCDGQRMSNNTEDPTTPETETTEPAKEASSETEPAKATEGEKAPPFEKKSEE
jgi:hypothetical protein